MYKFFLSFLFLISLSIGLWGQTTNELYEKGKAAEDPNERIHYFSMAMEKGQKDNWIYYYRGWSWYSVRKYERAIEDFEAGLKAEGNIDLAFIYAGLAWSWYGLDNVDEAKKAADAAIKGRKGMHSAWSCKGWLEIKEKNYAGAVEAFTQYINLQPDKDTGFEDRAYARYMMGDYTNAITDCDKALKIDPTNRQVVQWKAMCLLKLGKKEEGIALVKDAVQYVEDDPLSLSRIGNMFYDHGDYKTAIEFHTQGIELYNKKIAIDPDFIRTHKDQVYNIYLSRGDAWEMLEKYQEANISYQKAVTIDGTRHEAWLEIGELQTMQGNWREAVTAYEKAFAIDPNEKNGWVNLGYCYSNLKEDRRAVDAYTRGIKNNPGVGLLYNNRGFTYLEMKNYPASLKDLQKAIEVEPDEVMSHVSLGEYYLEVGNKEEAISKLTEALNMENGSRSSYVAGYYKRGLAYFQLEQYEKAEQDLKYAVTLDAKHVKAIELLGKTYYFLKKRCSAYKMLHLALDIDARNRVKECTDAALYLAKLTHNPCTDPNEK